jgi:ABC-type phosphate transport system substrate-binding protein
MPAFKQRLARIGASAGVLAATTAAILAVGGAGASVASAACVAKGEGTALAGNGSSLQKEAQANWTNGTHFGAECPETPVTYTPTSSGKGLAAFGFTSGSIDHKTAFIGTDDGPNATQIASAESVSKTKPLIIPVAETAIAVVINPPANCELQTGVTHGIGWVALTQIFGGKEIKTWAQLATAEVVKGTGCTGEITRVVRAEGSGTTYQFKNYLAVLQGEFGGKAMPCSLAGFNEAENKAVTTTSWKDMRQVGTEEKPNITWPEPSNCAETSPVVRKAGGGAIAEYVAATDGTIGYAALPDAKAKGAEVAQLQDVSTPRYAGPVKPSTTESNCGARIYTVPAAGRTGTGTGEGADWSQVFGAAPAVGSSLYPLCTLTYDVSWKSYEAAGYKEPESGKPAMVAANVKSYMQYLLGTSGQTVLTEHYYQKLPTGTSINDVLGAAELAAGKIG